MDSLVVTHLFPPSIKAIKYPQIEWWLIAILCVNNNSSVLSIVVTVRDKLAFWHLFTCLAYQLISICSGVAVAINGLVYYV